MNSTALLGKLSDGEVNATVIRSSEAAATGPKMQDEKFAVGLVLLLTLILLGVAVSILLCVANHREPTLWTAVFGGLIVKNSSTPRQFVKFPRRVRFQLPDSHSNRGSSNLSHTLLSPKTNDEGNQRQDDEEGTITIY